MVWHNFSRPNFWQKVVHHSTRQLSTATRQARVTNIWPAIGALLLVNMVASDAHNANADDSGTVYRKDEVATHTSKDKGIWVSYKDGVYDITKFVASHPGGKDKILLAAGKDIEPFWNVYRQHYNSKLPLELLENMRIGSLHPDDVAAAAAQNADSSDPYSSDPHLAPYMIYIQEKPINAEAPGFMLTDSWLTDASNWFVRNHHPVPHIDERTFRLRVDTAIASKPGQCSIRNAKAAAPPTSSEEDGALSLSVEQLKSKFRQHTVVAAIQCGGNRRGDMNSKGTTSGNAWGIGGISNGKFRGVLLRDLLLSAGVADDDVDERVNPCNRVKHVVFEGEDGLEVSIPIRTAMDRYADVLLACEMNDAPLSAAHGFPLRLVVPGHVGVRNAKWLRSIRLSEEEAGGTWQRGIAYKGFGPSERDLNSVDVDSVPTTQEPPVQSAITLPRPNSSLVVGEPFTVQGYAYSGGGRAIIRVDVSADGGQSWRTARRTDGAEQPLDRAWGWTFWECEFPAPTAAGAQLELVCKATDASYNVQPDSLEGIWNLRGINNNAWHRVSAAVVEEQDEGEDEEDI